MRTVFVTGASGTLGRALIPELLARGHGVHALVRAGREARLPPGCTRVVGDALSAASFVASVPVASTLVHLVGTPSPAPWKARAFRAIDLVSLRSALAAARARSVAHFVYVSVAQPAPVMRACVRVRAECEAQLRSAGLAATILRPWYVLGPRHRWPLLLLPLYWLAELVPALAPRAQRLGLVRLEQMIAALVWAVEHPCVGQRVLEVPEIRRHAASD
ncbi:MAG: NAD(P)H-binding protein [Planctomycetes bacterium]|nr:NAD(P)H-binding protein [Planctomycetota bacterium]